jgi:predicted O-methyltransferase YrrM
VPEGLRPSIRFLGKRRVGHWTPQYLYHRVRSLYRATRHPTEPWLTPEAIRLLGSLLRPIDVGVEWGSGNSTRWLVSRTAHLTSFETSAGYYARVAPTLSGLPVDYHHIAFDESVAEAEVHRSDWVRAADSMPDESLDYALVDSAPQGCLCAAVLPKLKPGGLLILDNADWFIPTATKPRTPGLATRLGAHYRHVACWPHVMEQTARWRRIWTSNGVTMTLLMLKTD